MLDESILSTLEIQPSCREIVRYQQKLTVKFHFSLKKAVFLNVVNFQPTIMHA